MAATDVLSLAEARQIVGLRQADSPKDDLLAMFVTGVSERLDSLVGPVVERTITNELHDGGAVTVLPKQYPVSTLTQVVEYEDTAAATLTAETPTSQPADAYVTRIDLDGHISAVIRRESGADARFAGGRSNIRLDYTAGRYSTTGSVGSEFKQAAGLMLQNWWRSQESRVIDAGDYDVPTQAFPTYAVPRAVRELLARHIQAGPHF